LRQLKVDKHALSVPLVAGAALVSGTPPPVLEKKIAKKYTADLKNHKLTLKQAV
jgi:hypothetical protein